MSAHRRSSTAISVAAVAVAVACAMLCVATHAQMAPSPSPSSSIVSECMNAVLNVTDCLSYVEAGSTAKKPDKNCCPELAGLIESNPVCLCALLAGAAESFGITIDNSRALALPGVCHISTPPVSTCAALGIPVNIGPSQAPMSGAGPSPSSGVPRLPAGSTPLASPPPHSQAAHLLSTGNLISLAALSLAVAAAGIF